MRSAIAAAVTVVLAGSACGARPPPPPVVDAVVESEPPDADAAATPPSWALVAGGVTACAAALPGGPACWGSWGDSVPEDVDFDPHAPRALPADVLEVALGWTHACLRTATDVRCDGRYEMGDAVAAEPGELVGTRRLASGRDFTCGIRPDGALACVAARPHPGLVAPLAPTGLRALAATSSGWQLCALGDGAAWCWPSLDRAPIAVSLPPDAEDLVMASGHGCVRAPDGAPWCWPIEGGSPTRIDAVEADALAALGDRVCAREGAHWICLTPDASVPERIARLDGARAIAGGMGFVCGAFDDGLRCLGDDDLGQLGAFGTPAAPRASAPPRVEASGARRLSLERARACIVTADERVACWGEGPRRVVPGLSHVVELRSGHEHTCARTERGEVRCWGRMLVDHGEDVDPSWRAFSARRRLATGAIAIASGPDDACVLRGAPPSLRCWGSPFAIPGDEWLALPEPARTLATAASETCAIGASGTAWCAESGAEALTEDEAWRGAEALAATDTVRCALGASEVRCAGRNGRGQLGDGTRTARARPVRVRDVTGAIGVAIGEAHACALLASGEVRCWGANEMGQLGDGTRTDRWRAVTVAAVAHAVDIAAAGSTSCARLEDGTVACWGAPIGSLGETLDASEPAATPRFP